MSRQFAAHGLQFFKVNKTVIHVSVARPLFLDLETTPVSDGIKRIVNFINAHAEMHAQETDRDAGAVAQAGVIGIENACTRRPGG